MRTFLTWYETGGPFMAPLALMSVVGLLLLVDRVAAVVRRSKVKARPFIERVISLVRSGKVDEALKVCAEHQSLVPDLGLIVLRSGLNDEPALRQLAEAARLTSIPALTLRITWLRTIAHVLLLLGAGGAAANLISALSQPGSNMAVAIAFAAKPLAAGICSAIPLVIVHALLSSDARHISAQMEEFSARLVNALLQRPDVRLGHR